MQDAITSSAARLGAPRYELATTASFVVVKGDVLLAGQVGDSPVVLESTSDGYARAFRKNDNGSAVNQTDFVTGHCDLSLLLIRSDAVRSAIVMSDGLAESLIHRASGAVAPALHSIMQIVGGRTGRSAEAWARNELEHGVLRQKTFDDLAFAAIRW